MSTKLTRTIFLLVVVVGLGFLLVRGAGGTDPSDSEAKVLPVGTSTSSVLDPQAIAKPADPPPGYVKYENKKYKFSYWHSPEAVIKEYDEGGGAMTIVQENAQKVRGLQIFIVPYYEPKITQERFLMDVPSGVMENMADTTVGELGIPAITFTSRDKDLGETRELWFVYEGHLYEITTFRGMAEWFTPIMQSWRFIMS